MKHWTRLLAFVLVIAVLGASSLPLSAQSGAGQGGIIIDANANKGTDVATMNPLLNNDVYSALITGLLFPTLVGIDPEKGNFAPDARGGLTKSWDVSSDGLTITYHLRDDYKWSDGTPVTAQDFIYSYNAIASGKTSSPRTDAVDVIDSVSSPDDYTLVIKYKTPACNNIDETNEIVPVPAHVLQQQIGSDYSKMDKADFNTNPTVSDGVFNFSQLVPGQQVSLQASTVYPDTLNGAVNPTGFIYKNVDDVDVALQQFEAGDLNLMDVFTDIPPQNFPDLRAKSASGDIQTYEQLNNGYEWLAFNLADPTKPIDGVDADGKPVAQPPHPIFGDVRVRQALAKAVDINAIIQGALFGEAVPATSPSIATSWAFNPDLKPISVDLDAANKMLTDAGWIDDDNNPDTPRVAKGAKYAPDGTKLAFSLITSASDSTVVAVGQLIQDQFKKVGAQVDFQAIDFNTAVQKLVGQTFDTALLGWSLSYPDNPDFGFAFNASNDKVGGGFNFVSYYNQDVTDLLSQANNLPGCDPTGRAKLYQQAQEKLVADQPYIFLYTSKAMIAASSKLDGFKPYPNQLFWNVDTWNLAP
ncbi:MAG TPA: ABC transporter substrate-binding protein [Phototrophicaceae bacterium]|nr:ABC transporter substrate-binding protein [Phototrophicaceae bacterium]